MALFSLKRKSRKIAKKGSFLIRFFIEKKNRKLSLGKCDRPEIVFDGGKCSKLFFTKTF